MAIHRIPILGWPGLPDNSGKVFFEPYDVKASNDVWKRLVLILNDPAASERFGIHGGFTVPKNYVGTPKLIVIWTSTANTGNFRLKFKYRAVGGSESLDQTGQDEDAAATAAAPGTAHNRVETSVTLGANFAADDEVEFTFDRDDDSGTDTMAAAAIVHALLFEYADA